MQGEKILIIGNDKKMVSCRDNIIDGGYECICTSATDIKDLLPLYKYIVLPLPTIKGGKITGTDINIEDFKNMVTSNNKVFYGNLKENIFNCEAESYYNENFKLQNSYLTAQGTLRVILENSEGDLRYLKAAVIGYGKCGKEICRVLKNNGSSVTTFARRAESRAKAEGDGITAKDIEGVNKELYGYNVIINTVPCNIIGKKCLTKLNENNLYIEIASEPYGFDISDLDSYCFRYVLAASLPGKFTASCAGKNIADTILDLIKEGKHE